MAWHEWPLILFTVLSQTTVGAFLVLGCVTLSGKLSQDEDVRLHRNMFFIWVLMGLGLIASTMHLGSPLRAFNALNRVGSSWLSNEIFASSLFFAAGGFYWLLKVVNKGSDALKKGLLLISMVIGIGFMYAMIKVYLINTVPTWNSIYTPIMFLLTMAISGLAFAHTLLVATNHKHAELNNALPVFASIALAISLMATVGQLIGLSHISSAIIVASDIIPNMATLQVLRLGLLFVGLVLMFSPRLMSSQPKLPVILLSFVCILVSELINRGVFYGLHMSVGM
ncbi:dimethylsulfoxide reductase [Aliivibrio fischeri]|uniref:dimethyl sulfoxide reductase anchor subunit family protein n=1 Tax=Aliivibrio fischeri TaxID=668 RepID=UPI0012D8BE96|nr:DmsC/YnfH family molybdoenzyme membrane anchor subunit [Aliivibrio fischeri]MUK62294.1 dimethylsulfoxide reductase [Aliivibrio fischeri]MUL21436.1 dimethylsulfoxide reductase [Aliivibrio fischeri]MUL23541.1 dimethylsulfoxide reductase [Aliivibrio fischeri]